MQASFRELSDTRNLWAGATVATQQDLSALFVVRCIELYLQPGGQFGFVMPLAALSRRQFAGFRVGRYRYPVKVAYRQPWDLHAVKPSFFPVPACVAFGEQAEISVPLTAAAEVWSGRLPVPNASWEVAARYITRAAETGQSSGVTRSPYAQRFANGATVFPRVLFMVEARQATALGTGAGRQAVRSQRSPTEKRPWSELPALEGMVESEFIRPLYLGENLLPYRMLPPRQAVIPWDGKKLLDGGDDQIDDYPGLAAWWRAAEREWNTHRSTDRMTLLERLNFRRGLSSQFPPPVHRVVYTKGGMYLAAARVSDPSAVIENTLYWSAASGIDEARYLTAILNSDTLTQLVRPLQARGEHNPRHFDKYIFQLPIPLYDPGNPEHRQLAELAERAEEATAVLELPPRVSFQAQRRRIREALSRGGLGGEINNLTSALLAPASE